MKYSVIMATENENDKPDFVPDAVWKDMQHHIKDEEMSVVLRLEDNEWWPADEFFSMMDVKNFEVID